MYVQFIWLNFSLCGTARIQCIKYNCIASFARIVFRHLTWVWMCSCVCVYAVFAAVAIAMAWGALFFDLIVTQLRHSLPANMPSNSILRTVSIALTHTHTRQTWHTRIIPVSIYNMPSSQFAHIFHLFIWSFCGGCCSSAAVETIFRFCTMNARTWSMMAATATAATKHAKKNTENGNGAQHKSNRLSQITWIVQRRDVIFKQSPFFFSNFLLHFYFLFSLISFVAVLHITRPINRLIQRIQDGRKSSKRNKK